MMRSTWGFTSALCHLTGEKLLLEKVRDIRWTCNNLYPFVLLDPKITLFISIGHQFPRKIKRSSHGRTGSHLRAWTLGRLRGCRMIFPGGMHPQRKIFKIERVKVTDGLVKRKKKRTNHSYQTHPSSVISRDSEADLAT